MCQINAYTQILPLKNWPWQRSLNNWKKEVPIDHIHANNYHLVKMVRLGSVDPETIWLELKKRNKLTQAKHMALSASLLSGLN